MTNTLRISIASIVAAAMLTALLPLSLRAAFNDVTITEGTNTEITVNGIDLLVSGSGATIESFTAGDTSLVFSLQSGSSFQVSSPTLNSLTATGADVTDATCNDNESFLRYTATSAVDITVTVSTDLCSSGSGGGGGGGSNNDDDDDDQPTTTNPGKTLGELQAMLLDLMAKLAELKGTPVSIAGGVFSMDLDLGAQGADVTKLQEWLIAKGHAIPAGATGYFGAQTQAAVAAYQASKGITPAVGYFGPKTRASVNAGS